jgi:DNA-directed RNA polymerase III subunit RPC4
MSIAPTTNKRRGKPSGPRESSNTSRGGHSALKRESALSTSGGRGRAATKTREPKNEDTVDREYLSSDEDDGNPRIDVKKINTIDDPIVVDDDEDNEEEPITNRKRSNAPRQSYPSWGLKPVTMDRKEHIERSGGIHIDSNDAEMLRKRAKERRDTGLFIRDESEEINTKSSRRKKKTQDVEFISATRKWKGVYTDSEEEDEEVGTKVKAPVSKTKVKKEPRDDQPNIPEATSDSVTIDSSPEAATRTPLPETTFTAKLKPKTLKHSARSAPRATEEELREWTRQNTDIRVVAEELQQNGIHMTPTIPNNTLDPLSPTSTQETTSSVTMVSTTETSATVEPEDKEGRLYVFQFPPLLPDLYNPLESAPAPAPVPILVPESSTAQTPIQIPDSTSTSNPTKTKPSSSKASKTSQAAFTPLDPPKSSTGHPTIKPDPDSSSSNTINNTTNSTSTPPSSYPTKNPPGFVGYLTIHRSRRIRLCWGGFDCDVSRGVEVAFAENAVVVADSSSSFPTSSLNSSNPAAAAAAGKKHSSAMDLDMDMDNNNNAPAIEGMGMRAEGGRMRSEKEGEKEEEDEEEGREAGFQKATSLGSIRGKLVVVPDWGRVLGSSPSSSLS